MPLYEYECPTCGSTKVDMRTIAERNDAPNCFRCKKAMALILSAVQGFVKNPAADHTRRV